MKHKTKENLTKQFEIWIKVFNTEAIISFVLDNMLRSQLEQNALIFIQSQKWENIKNLISHEDEANRNLGFSLLEGQTSTQVRLFFEKSSDDLIELIKIIKNFPERFSRFVVMQRRMMKEQTGMIKCMNLLGIKISEAKTQIEKEELMKEYEKLSKHLMQSEEVMRNGMDLVNQSTGGINYLIHKIEEIFKKHDVNLEESQIFTSS